jgi:transcriptional regulator with XRE-family HTH domain
VTKQATRQIKEIVAANIKAARVSAGLTQRELGRAVNDVPALAVYRWEAGLVMPNTSNLAGLADALGCDIAWFYTDHEREAA